MEEGGCRDWRGMGLAGDGGGRCLWEVEMDWFASSNLTDGAGAAGDGTRQRCISLAPGWLLLLLDGHARGAKWYRLVRLLYYVIGTHNWQLEPASSHVKRT